MATTVTTTTLSFGLVACEVKLKKVSEAKQTGFKLASPDGNPVKQLYVDQVTGEQFETGALQKGLFDGDTFTPISADDLTAIDDETKIEGITIEGFISTNEIPYERIRDAYFLAPGGQTGPVAAKALAILRSGIKKGKRAGFGKLTIRAKSYPFVISERNGTLVLNTLYYADEFTQVREGADALEGVKLDPKTVALASQLVQRLTVPTASLDVLTDDRRALREELIASALAGKKPTKSKKKAARPQTTELLEVLRASVEEKTTVAV